MSKKLRCPNCKHELQEDRNFNIELTYIADISPSDNDDGYDVGSASEFLRSGTIYCSKCGEEFEEFEEVL